MPDQSLTTSATCEERMVGRAFPARKILYKKVASRAGNAWPTLQRGKIPQKCRVGLALTGRYDMRPRETVPGRAMRSPTIVILLASVQTVTWPENRRRR